MAPWTLPSHRCSFIRLATVPQPCGQQPAYTAFHSDALVRLQGYDTLRSGLMPFSRRPYDSAVSGVTWSGANLKKVHSDSTLAADFAQPIVTPRDIVLPFHSL